VAAPYGGHLLCIQRIDPDAFENGMSKVTVHLQKDAPTTSAGRPGTGRAPSAALSGCVRVEKNIFNNITTRGGHGTTSLRRGGGGITYNMGGLPTVLYFFAAQVQRTGMSCCVPMLFALSYRLEDRIASDTKYQVTRSEVEQGPCHFRCWFWF
jgi:hypothetical protein